MKHIKKFESFQLDEGILDDMKAKVKGWFKGDKEEDPVDQKPSISTMKKNSARYDPLPAKRPYEDESYYDEEDEDYYEVEEFDEDGEEFDEDGYYYEDEDEDYYEEDEEEEY